MRAVPFSFFLGGLLLIPRMKGLGFLGLLFLLGIPCVQMEGSVGKG